MKEDLDSIRHTKEIILKGIYLSMVATFELASTTLIANIFKGRVR
jgi:hypothetical protein